MTNLVMVISVCLFVCLLWLEASNESQVDNDHLYLYLYLHLHLRQRKETQVKVAAWQALDLETTAMTNKLN